MKQTAIENKGIYNDGLSAVFRMLCAVVRHISYGRFSLLGRGQATFIVLLLLSVSAIAQNTFFRTEAGVPYIPVLATAPTPTSVGAFYTNSTDNLTYWYDGTKWIPVDLGVIAYINLTSNPVLYKTQTITPEIRYIYTGNNTASTCTVTSNTYTWYRADDAMGTNKTVITNGTGTPSSYTVVAGDVGKYIGLGITPVTTCNTASFESVSWKPVSALTPTVARVDVSGLTGTSALANNQLTATFSGYTCTPVLIPGDAGASCTYQWYYATDASGTGKTAISGKTASTYTVSFSDGYAAGKYLAVGITPVASNGDIGTEKVSTWYATATLVPAYDVVNITGLTGGNAKNATTIAALKGTFSITPAMSGAEGTPTYQWYYASSSTGTGKTAITGQTASTHTVNIGGSYGYLNNLYYLAAGVTPVATTGETGTEVLSSWVKIQVDKAADGSTAVNELTSSSGRIWMDRNLGATQAATSSTDYLAYGSLYQWCRASDGHEKIAWTSATAGTPLYSTTSTLSTSTTPGHSFFITSTATPYDWITPQQSDESLWWNGTARGANNPCPTGFHVPTYAEWNAELPYITNAATAYSTLKLTEAGFRNYDGSFSNDAGSGGHYWSSTIYGIVASGLYFTASSAIIGTGGRVAGISVRCIKDLDAPQAQSVSISGTPMQGSAVTGIYTYVPPQTTGSAEGTSTYKWYVATDGIGTGKTAISGATARNYTLASPVVVGQYIAFGVTPVSADGKTGAEVLSTWVNVQSSPTVTSPDGTLVVDLLSSSGRTWMDRNLGASRAATSSTDYLAYGSLYQWCRSADGHERITWTSATAGTPVYGTTSTLSTSTTGHSLFIKNGTTSPYDWLSTQQTDGSLWWNGTVVGANSPCPAGYHVPTLAEWNTELALFASNGGANATGAYNTLKIPLAGIRRYDNGSLDGPGVVATLWSSTVNATQASTMALPTGNAGISSAYRAYGMSVRCIKDLNTTAVVDIVSPTTGRTWMDRNIGATQAATSKTDASSYGSLFQWCRGADGHQLRTSSLQTAQIAATTTGNANFIYGSTDWSNSGLTDGTLWWNGVTTAGANSPCPAGYHVPTYSEWSNEIAGIPSSGQDDWLYNRLKLTLAGYRDYNTGSIYQVGNYSYYWSGTANGTNAWYLNFTSSMFSFYRAYGFSVRCIKNLEVPQAQSVSISGTAAVGNTVTGVYVYMPTQTTATAEGASVYRWYVATDATGTGKTSITGATAKTYTIASPVGAGKYIAFGVTPVSTDGKTGTEVLSSWVVVTSQTTAYDGTVVNELISPSGRVWMDRNLGANRVATSPTDYLAYGSLFQWCRAADGHEKITWTSATTGTAVNGTTTTLSTTTTPAHSLFIYSAVTPFDWLSTQQTDGSLWWNGSAVGANNPCPSGYHMPTYAEWTTEQSNITNSATAYSSLKLTMSGDRSASDGLLYNIGSAGFYWSSTANSTQAGYFQFDSNSKIIGNTYRGQGFSVRCIKNLTAPDGTLVVDMVSPSGRTWMDRNLGASRQATSSTDYLAYGSLYQWCRPADGHQKINWTSATAGTAVNTTTSTLSTTTTPGHSLFILGSTAPYDWLSTQQPDGSLWWSGATAGVNTPCPAGYHVPTYLELASELALFASNGGANATGAYNVLKLPMAGGRSYGSGSLLSMSSYGYYWSSSVNGMTAYDLNFSSSVANMDGSPYRANGLSIRCIKDIPLPVTTTVVDMVSPSGRTWMDRNIGASRAASSSTDYQAYGSLFQWCRAADNHEKIIYTSSTTGTPVYNTYSTLSSTTVSGHSLFIINASSPYDWLSTQQTDGMLWWNGIVAGTNTPCPTGYHVPTYAEWNTEQALFAANGGANAIGAYNVLKLPMAGFRSRSDGSLGSAGINGYYWSSTVTGTDSYLLSFSSSSASTISIYRTVGYSVRCIKNQTDIPKAQGVSVTGSVMMGATLTGSYTYVPPQISATAEGTSTYKWYVATDATGTGSTAISGATAKTYVVASPVALGKYIAFGVTPVSSDGKIGSEALSSWVPYSPDGTSAVDITSPATGRVWMDRNLGASRAATSSTDYLAYGSLYQWCRPADGHQLMTWTSSTSGTPVNGTTTTLSSSTTPGNSLFILSSSSPYDWLSTQQSDGSLWWNGSVAGANNPCPSGYHVPTFAEWTAELTYITNATTAYSTLKLPVAGNRYNGDGSFSDVGNRGIYWTTTIRGTISYDFASGSGGAGLEYCNRAYGFSVRCIKN